MAYIYQCHLLPCVLRRFLSPCAHATRPATPRTPPPPRPTSVIATASRVSTVPTPPHAPTTSRRQLLPGRPGQTRGHTAGTLAPARRTATPPAAPRYALCACSSILFHRSPCMKHYAHMFWATIMVTVRTCCSRFLLFLCACFDTVAKLCWLSLAYVHTSTNVCIDHKPKRILS